MLRSCVGGVEVEVEEASFTSMSCLAWTRAQGRRMVLRMMMSLEEKMKVLALGDKIGFKKASISGKNSSSGHIYSDQRKRADQTRGAKGGVNDDEDRHGLGYGLGYGDARIQEPTQTPGNDPMP